MHNIKLTIAYDGGDFHGWQVQPGLPTIQGAVCDLIRRITQESVTLIGAGRTDAGVHAWGQVANFKTASKMSPEEFARALNALLPSSVRIRRAEEVSPDFHARWLACAKTYRYRIHRGRIVSPFLWRYVLHHPQPLDFAAMAAAARHLVGEHDFTSFAASTGSPEEDQDRLTRRRIFSSEMVKRQLAAYGDCLAEKGREVGGHGDDNLEGKNGGQEEWIYEVRGVSFLRNMVRKMVGTLLEVGRGRLTPDDIPRLIALSDRASAGPTAPAHGLCLHSVEYPDPVRSLSGTTISSAE